jgi:4-amino-4-deoxy-L-arabinose transferase-like glycosyltransferase
MQAAILIAAAVFLCLHWVHLSADFPNQSPWQDWSKYTDEGWYGDAAIRHFQLGHWYVPGDFNPAAALPVWPILEGLVFLFTGVSLVAVRALTVAVFAGTLVAAWFLIRKHSTRPRGFAASAAVLLLAVSPFCFGFTRLAILEPLLVLLTLLSLLVASQATPASRSLRQNLPIILALGIL